MPIHRYSFSERFFEEQRPYTAEKKLENLPRTDKQTNKQTDKQTENSITEATLIPCGSSGSGPILEESNKENKLSLHVLI